MAREEGNPWWLRALMRVGAGTPQEKARRRRRLMALVVVEIALIPLWLWLAIRFQVYQRLSLGVLYVLGGGTILTGRIAALLGPRAANHHPH